MQSLGNIEFKSTNKELVSALLLTTGSPYNYYVAYSIKLPALVKKGSILIITANGEVTNNYAYNVGVGSFLALGTSPSDTTYPNYNNIDALNGQDIIDNGTQGHNHCIIPRPHQWQAPEDLVNKYLNYVVYAYSSSAAPGDAATLMQYYGQLAVTILSP